MRPRRRSAPVLSTGPDAVAPGATRGPRHRGRGAPGVRRETPTPAATPAYGRELKTIRETLGLTQVALAEALGIRSDSLSRYERGTRHVPEPTMRLARRLLPARQRRDGASDGH